MDRKTEERLRAEWNYFKVEGEEALCNWLKELPSWVKASNQEIVLFLNYKLMHGPKDSKFLALTGFKEAKNILKDYITHNDKKDFYYLDAILGLSCYGDEEIFDLIEERLKSDIQESFCSRKYALYWLENIDFKRAKDILEKYKMDE